MLLLRATLPGVVALACTAGCGDGPSEACEMFLTCAAHYAETFDVAEPETVPYDAGGRCWRDPVEAEACDQQCLDTAAAYEATLEAAGEDLGDCEGAGERRASAGAEADDA